MSPALRIACVWCLVAPAFFLWLIAARARQLSDDWALKLPLMIAFVVLAFVINKAPPWKLTGRTHLFATIGLALGSTLLLIALVGLVQMALALH